LPLGLWSAAAVWDAAALATGRAELWLLAFGCLALGCAAGALAAATGLADFAALEDKGAEGAAFWHMGLMGTCWTLYLASLLVRGSWGPPSHPAAAVALDFAGLAVMGAGGWIGGHLVYTRGVGVEGKGYN
jgi:uncharacterized membrane protein